MQTPFFPQTPILKPDHFYTEKGISTLKASGLWLGGIDLGNNLKGAIQMYNQDDATDFIPGCLDPSTGEVGEFNKIWHVSAADIEEHIADFEDDGIINNPNHNVFAWPARGNPFFSDYNDGMEIPNTNQGLAGFWDANGSGGYNPTNGDYPILEIRGCLEDPTYASDMWWFVFNDNVLHSQSQTIPIKMEIQCQVFKFACEEETPINNTVFARYKLMNRAPEAIDSMYFGTFLDLDIGNEEDDFFGTDGTRSIVFGYNGDLVDQNGYGANSPVMSMDFLRGPIFHEDGQIEEIGMKHVMPVPEDEELTALQYYRLLSGSNIDGSSAPNNGMYYTDNPNNPDGWSEVTSENAPGKRRVVASAGPFLLQPGAVNEVILAYTFHHEVGNTPLQNVDYMYGQVDEVQAFFDGCFNLDAVGCSPTVGVSEIKQISGRVFPTPANEELNIILEGEMIEEIKLVDLAGRFVKAERLNLPIAETKLSIADLTNGTYFLLVKTIKGDIFKEKVVVLK